MSFSFFYTKWKVCSSNLFFIINLYLGPQSIETILAHNDEILTCDWNKYNQILEKESHIGRKILKQPLKLDIAYSSFNNDQKLVLSLFKIKSIHLTTLDKYQEFINFISEVPEKNSLSFDRIFLGKGRHENVMSEAGWAEEYKTYHGFAESYTATVDILSNKGLDHYIESYWDITQIMKWKVSFINTIVIDLLISNNITNLPACTKYLLENSQVEFNHVLVFWSFNDID